MWYYTLLPKIVNMSLTGSIVILAVMLARLLLRRAPKLFSYALWAAVLFRLLCPISVLSDFSVLNLVDVPVSNAGTVEYISLNSVHTENAFAAQPAVGRLEGFMAAATVFWLAGVIGLLLYSVISPFRLRQKLVGAVHLRENTYLVDHIDSAFVLGVFVPKVYLASNLSENEQGYILQHEKCHIRRGDHIIKILAFAALCIHWFNPLAWIAFILAGSDMEMSCDEAVMGKMDGDIRANYATVLLHQSVKKRNILAAPLAFGEGDVKRRIKNVLNYKKPMLWVKWLIVGAVIFFSICLISNPSQSLAVTDVDDTGRLTEAARHEEDAQAAGTTVSQIESEYLFLYTDTADMYEYYTAFEK